MSSGMKREVINSRERAVSTDINRLQDFLASEVGQAFYAQCGKYAVSDDIQPGTEAAPAVGGVPPFNAVLSGLRPYPVNGTVDMLVTPGELLVDNLAATGDDAPMLFSNDPGITAIGTLQLTGAPGAVRIDVIECQATTAVLETDNRDIYNIVTGLFAPAMVTKVTAARLTYRIRLGTPGAGFPGVVAGWVPLAVCKVDASAATWDTVEVWDVRNLVSEFWNAPYNVSRDESPGDGHLVAVETNAAAPYDILLRGHYEGQFGAHRIGGEAANYPTAAVYIDVTKTTTNWASGMALVASIPWYVYCAFPFGLPGWRKYNSAAVSPRVPYGMRGIPVVTQIAPNVVKRPIFPWALPLPTSCGLGGTTAEAVCIFSGMVSSAPRIRGGMLESRRIVNKERLQVNAAPSDPLVTGVSVYTIVDTTHVPSFAVALIGEVTLTVNGAAPPGVTLPVMIAPVLRVYDATGTFITYELRLGTRCAFILAAGISCTWEFPIDIPLPYQFVPSSRIFDIQWNIDSAGYVYTTVTADRVQIRGWRM